MQIRYPRPLRPGDTIGVTAPSSGVGDAVRGRFDHAVSWLRERGYEVQLGECLDGTTHVSAPVLERAAELQRMLTDPEVRAVIPPWGGETAIDLLPHLDMAAVAAAEPTWMVGFSDISTILTPLTLLTGWATLHGTNLMDTPYEVPAPLLSWLDVATAGPGATLRQASPGMHRASGWDDWGVDPTVSQHTWDGSGAWRRIDRSDDVDGAGGLVLEGRVVGGCIETQSGIAGTPFGRTAALRGASGADGPAGVGSAGLGSAGLGSAGLGSAGLGSVDVGSAGFGSVTDGSVSDRSGNLDDNPEAGPLIVYIEAAGEDALSICRRLHGMRLAGYFDGAAAVLVGRTSAPDSPTMTQDEAVLDALGSLGVPIVADVECGHVPPYLLMVNGAWGRLVWTEDEQYLEQSLV